MEALVALAAMRRQFFFEKKEPKNFWTLAQTLRRAYARKSKSLLLLFFRKEDFSSWCPRSPPQAAQRERRLTLLSGKTSSRNRALQATYGDRHPHRPYSRPRHILELTIMRVHGIYWSSRQSVILPALSAAFAVALVASPVAAQAQDTSSGSAMSQHETKADMHAETIDQRIATLHEELKITPAEESDWNAVATTMRENADAMEKLANEKESQSKQGMTAVEDLQTYSQFAQEHVDHLKKLTSVFETLYNAMPSEQKKVADEVFARSQHQAQDNQG